MITVSVASGKGGAGKTSIAAALSEELGADCVVADCDVDAPNLAIALGASAREREPYLAGPGFSIDGAACTGCGLCAEACRFEALRPEDARYAIIQELCERCGACLDRCPAGAIATAERRAGELFVSDTRLGVALVHAELAPGEDTSGKLVAKVRERAKRQAGEGATMVVDSPPGIGCPVIASMTGSDLVVVVVEASASGIRDASRLVELVASMRRRAIGILNKTGLDAGMDGRARALLAEAGIPLAGAIPFDPSLRSAEESGRTWSSLDGNGGAAAAAALRAVRGALDGISRRRGSSRPES